MKLMQTGNHYIICNGLKVLRINGKVFYTDIGDIINAYLDTNSFKLEDGFYPAIECKDLCMCEFSTKESLKHQMVEYLI